MYVVQTKFPMSPGADRRTFRERTFSKLGKGSLRGSIFSLCASAIGSGVLSLPYVLKLNGYVQGVLFMLLGALAAEWSLSLLAHCAVSKNLKNFTGITNAAGGPKLTALLSYSIFLFMFVSCISYQIIISSLLQYVMIQLKFDEKFIRGYLFRIP